MSIIAHLQESRVQFERAGEVASGQPMRHNKQDYGDGGTSYYELGDEAVAISKTWLVEAELVLEKCAARDEIKIEYNKRKSEESE